MTASVSCGATCLPRTLNFVRVAEQQAGWATSVPSDCMCAGHPAWKLSTGCCPVQEVELLELPDNTPEVVPITCNGILGHFVVRTKTVVDEHFKEHKVTSFAKETGTNNPWKTAMHIATAGVRRA